MKYLKLLIIIGLCLFTMFLVGCKSSVFLSEGMMDFEVMAEKPVLSGEMEQEILELNSDWLIECEPHQLTDEQWKAVDAWIEYAGYFSEFDYEMPDKFKRDIVIDKLSEQSDDEMMISIIAENYDLDRRMLTDLKFKSSFEVQLGEKFFIDEYGTAYVAALSTLYLDSVESVDLYKYAKEIVEELLGSDATEDEIMDAKKELNRVRDFYIKNKGKWLLTQKELLYLDFVYEDTNLWSALALSVDDGLDFDLMDDDPFMIDDLYGDDDTIEEIPSATVTLEGEMVRGRFLVPMRAIFEALGAVVDWDEATWTVTGTKDGISIKLTIDSSIAFVNDEEIELDVAATLINGRTYVPTRFVSEALGADVAWDGDKRMATITQNGMVIEVYEVE